MLDATAMLEEGEWQAWVCCYCDPQGADPDNPADEANNHDRPYIVLLPMGEDAPDWCPRCDGHFSFLEKDANLRIANTRLQRAAERQQAQAG